MLASIRPGLILFLRLARRKASLAATLSQASVVAAICIARKAMLRFGEVGLDFADRQDLLRGLGHVTDRDLPWRQFR